jgi:hypothetical protein
VSFVLCHALVTKDERDVDAKPIGALGYPKIARWRWPLFVRSI